MYVCAVKRYKQEIILLRANHKEGTSLFKVVSQTLLDGTLTVKRNGRK